MTDKIGQVKNPLTIIAIFAGLAEVGGTVVLPLLQESTQKTYVWFLMIFPVLLVGVFFYVLYNKHHVLYVPSDFKSDSTFMDILQGITTPPPHPQFNETFQTLKQESADKDAQQNSASIPKFTELRPETRKVLKTLWKFQREQFPNDFLHRWCFTVGLRAAEYSAFSLGQLEAIKHNLVSTDPRGLTFLTDAGITYCRENGAAVEAEPEFYSNFSN